MLKLNFVEILFYIRLSQKGTDRAYHSNPHFSAAVLSYSLFENPITDFAILDSQAPVLGSLGVIAYLWTFQINPLKRQIKSFDIRESGIENLSRSNWGEIIVWSL
jgi:hypothetical protein